MRAREAKARIRRHATALARHQELVAELALLGCTLELDATAGGRGLSIFVCDRGDSEFVGALWNSADAGDAWLVIAFGVVTSFGTLEGALRHTIELRAAMTSPRER